MHAIPDQESSSAGCRLSLGALRYGLQRKDLVLVEHWQPHVPLPWSPPWYLGLVATPQGPVPLLQPPQQAADPDRPPKLLVVVRTVRGLLAVAADALEELPAGIPPDDSPDLAQALTALAAGLQPPAPLQGAAAVAQQRPAASSRVQLLRVRSGSRQVLVRAEELQQVGRHSGAQQLHPGDPQHWVVQFDEGLLAARSLAGGSNHDLPPGGEPWCLCPAAPAVPALLVQEVLGFVQAEAAQLHSLRHAGQTSHWLMRAPDEPLEILSFAGPQAGAADAPPSRVVSLHPVAPGPAGGRAHRPDSGTPSVHARGALRLAVGPWSLLLPARAVAAVAGRVAPHRLPAQRTARAVPVLDLRRLLGVPADAAQPQPAQQEHPMATLVTLGGRPMMLLSDQVSPAHEPGSAGDGEAWHPLPAAPAALHALLQSTRIRPSGCELLPQLRRARALRHPELRHRLCEAWAGWFTD